MWTDSGTDRRTDMYKLIAAFRNSAKALKIFAHTIPNLSQDRLIYGPSLRLMLTLIKSYISR